MRKNNKPFYQDDRVRLYQADVLSWALDYKKRIDVGNALPFMAVISDPPYGLGSPPPIDELLRHWLEDKDYTTGFGFMCKDWDQVVHPKYWRALLDICYPGAYLFAFSGTRTADLLGIACRLGGWKPFDRIMHWTYGCLSDDTEILTQDGWATYENVLAGSMVLCYNVKDNRLEWQKVQERFIYAYADTAYRIKSNLTDQIVSRNHRCLVERKGAFVYQAAETLGEQEKVPVLEYMPNVRDDFLDNASMEQEANSQLLSKRLSARMALNRPRESQAHAQNCTVGSCGTRQSRIESEKGSSRCKQSSLEGRRDVPKKKGKLCTIQNKIRSLSQRILGNGTQGRLHNGTPSNCSKTPGQNSKTLRGDTPQRPQSRKQQVGQSDAICKQQPAQAIRGVWRTRSTLASVTPFQYKGKVWCVRVPAGAFVARRNGKIFITGNSGFPKSYNLSKGLDASSVVPCPDCDGKGVILPNMPRESVQLWADRQGVTLDEAMLALSDQCETCDGSGQVVDVEREVIGVNPNAVGRTRNKTGGNYGNDHESDRAAVDVLTASATPLAQAFHGYGSALKPAGEPILLFRKSRAGRTFAQCAREFGSGGLNISDCRVETQDGDYNHPGGRKGGVDPGAGGTMGSGWYDKMTQQPPNPGGRWPPNTHFTHVPPNAICPACNGDGCDECHGVGMVGGCVRVGSKRVRSPGMQKGTAKDYEHNKHEFFGNESGIGQTRSDGHADPDGREEVADFICTENCPVKALDEMAGKRPSSARSNSAGKFYKDEGQIFKKSGKKHNSLHFDSGAVSRFFTCHDWTYEITERLAGETPFLYCAKASSSERNFGLTQHLPRTRNPRKRRHQDLDGSWLKRAVCRHPTVKPLSLLVWLCTLAKPPDMFKPRICIPFSGVMSEGIAARLAGWYEIHAIERERKYCVWGVARYKAMDKWATLTGKNDPTEIRTLVQQAQERESPRRDEYQTNLFGAMGLE